ncbi:MAG: Maf family protein [Gammaproteobacteria bacterium]
MVASLILASTSRYRRELLARLGITFETAAPHVNETLADGEAPADAALRLARAKARAVAEQRPEALVLASDQLADLDGTALGKPRDAAEARRRLAQMSGQTLTYCTAIALLAPGAERPETFLDESRVYLRAYDEEEISRYVAAANPLDCAGGLKLEGLGAALCERIETADPTALIGLPLIATARLLRAAGYPLP